jgi:hypothetical protein
MPVEILKSNFETLSYLLTIGFTCVFMVPNAWFDRFANMRFEGKKDVLILGGLKKSILHVGFSGQVGISLSGMMIFISLINAFCGFQHVKYATHLFYVPTLLMAGFQVAFLADVMQNMSNSFENYQHSFCLLSFVFFMGPAVVGGFLD